MATAHTEPLPPIDEHSEEDSLAPTDRDWGRWFAELPGGELSEEDAMALALEVVAEVRAEAVAAR